MRAFGFRLGILVRVTIAGCSSKDLGLGLGLGVGVRLGLGLGSRLRFRCLGTHEFV